MNEETSLARLDRMWAEVGAPDEWVLCSHLLRNGDLFVALGFVEEFRARHAQGRPIRLVVAHPIHLGVAAMYPALEGRLHLAPVLDGIPAAELMDWTHRRGLDAHAPGNFLLLQPWFLAHQPFELNGLVNSWQVSYVSLLATVLRLPPGTAPEVPDPTPAARETAREIAGRLGIIPGYTLVLFPYAQSFVTDFGPILREAARHALAAGWRVLTSCVPGREEPVPGTEEVFLPFDAVRPFCEIAGYAISVRSGLSDMLSRAACRHVILYDRDGLRDVWGMHAMGLGGRAEELVMPPGTEPGQAVTRLWGALLGTDAARRRLHLPADAAAFLDAAPMTWPAAPEGATPSLSRRIGLRHGAMRSRFLAAFSGLVLAEGWFLEPEGAWTGGRRASLFLRLAPPPGPPPRRLRLTLFGGAAVSPAFPDVAVTLRIGAEEARTVLRHGEPGRLDIAFEAVFGEPLLCEVLVDGPQSPALLSDGANPDTRRLGFHLERLTLEAEA